MNAYDRWVVRVVEGGEEAIAAELWAAGTIGIEIVDDEAGDRLLRVYFTETSAEERAGVISRLERLGGRVDSVDSVLEDDWMAGYRAAARPFSVGASLWIDPGEPDGSFVDAPSGRSPLRIPARTAFGIGSHESTRLAVELLEDAAVSGRRCLDLGTGSGILSFLLLLRGAARVVGLDIDPVAAFQARLNSRLNRLAPTLAAAGCGALSSAASFDLCVANMLPRHLLGELDSIAALVPQGSAVFSGVLAAEDRGVSERLDAAGFRIVERRRSGDWIGYRTTRELP